MYAQVAETAQRFRATVYPMLRSAGCPDCHVDNGVASASRLRFPSEDASDARVEAFGIGLTNLVNRKDPKQSPLALRPTNRVPHPGGERIRQGSAEETTLLAWIRDAARLPEDAAKNYGGSLGVTQTMLRRLTHRQYDNTVADLLGDRTRPARRFPPEDFVHGFTNQADAQSVSPLLAEDYSRTGTKLAATAARGGALARIAPCLAEATATDCAQRFVATFGALAFRRPVEKAEAARFERLFMTEVRRTGRAIDGAQLVAEAMLQSPAFLFHTATGDDAAASRLSYFLWDTMPDARLRDAAKSGRLRSTQGIEAEARRMLEDPRAREALSVFLDQWLRFDRLRGALRERKLYPEFGTELVASMIDETKRLFEHLVFERKNFMELFTARYSFLDSALARLYGLPSPPAEFARVEFPADVKRAGILGHASFLTVTSKPSETAPTERGLFIRERFLCQAVPPPPPGVNATLPLITEDRPVTNRERLSIHLTSPACAGCHRLVDSIGFGFEQYDAIGRFREQQVALVYPSIDKAKRNTRRDPLPINLPVDTKASIVGIANSEFHDPAQAASIIGNHTGCQRCIVKQLFRYAMGRMETDADQPYLDQMLDRFRSSGFQFQELVVALVTSKPFLEGIATPAANIAADTRRPANAR